MYLFSLAGVPVYASIWYFGLLAYMSYGAGLARGLLWGLCVTVSILVHEFGHAMVARHYRLQPSVMLHGWGGLCSHERADRDLHDALIVASGPLAGLALGGLLYAARAIAVSIEPQLAAPDHPVAITFDNLLYINIGWSLVNLAPLWPLDGGQLFRLLALRVFARPARAEQVTHVVGIVVGVVAIALAHFVLESMFLSILATLLTFQNVTQVGSTSASGPIRTQSRFGQELLEQAEQAFTEGDHREAARLCHQIRSDTKLSGPALDRVWAILTLASEALGRDDDAQTYRKRASDTALAAAARLRKPPTS